ncbi:hypothetical protein Prudu_247S000100 [Prunus dulcis]|uniref:Reverse transcriptase domain-containing protein n=1 Tax=Prunus dulcis TaxID=3755 RepID=A0A5H2XI50_PRUDU|nr:hypothetical protein Prudu_247S000100 [Prunus dulcis]
MGKISYFLNKLRKRKHNVDKTAFLTKNVSAILQTNTLPKYKDPVLYTEPVVHSNSQIPIILGRPFLATSNAHINYRNGLMQLSFGNMTLELNIFNICKKPANNEDVDKEVQEHNGWIPKYEELPTPLPAGLKYAFLGEDETYHVVISSKLELLHEGIIYPISDSKWVSPTYVVPKKSGVTVVENDNGEMVPTRVTAGWRMCIDYRYYQIEVSLEDQEKTTFACPFGTFAFRKMPFGLCNAPATFQRCMISIFSDMVEKYLEVFKDDITVFGLIPPHWTSQEKKKFMVEVRKFFWDETYHFKYCPDPIIRRCVPDDEIFSVISFCHSEACGGLVLLERSSVMEDHIFATDHLKL